MTNECKNKLTFTAVAALGIINTSGEMVSVSTVPKAFDRDDFMIALKQFFKIIKKRRSYILVDNLGVHRGETVK